MVDRDDPVEAAYGRMAILKAIVAAERRRAESKPYDRRNIDLGITEQDQPSGKVRTHIEILFDELETFLDHLTVLHMAASFETAATERLKNAVGAARKAVELSRKAGDRWPANLIRDADTFKGFHDIEQVLDLSASDAKMFAAIRKARNLVAHGGSLDKGPSIPADTARTLLVETLARMK